jgi:hypothetical protein
MATVGFGWFTLAATVTALFAAISRGTIHRQSGEDVLAFTTGDAWWLAAAPIGAILAQLGILFGLVVLRPGR